MPPVAHQQIAELQHDISQRHCHKNDQTLRQKLVHYCWPMKEVDADVEQDDKANQLHRTAQQLHQQVVELGLGFRGQVFQPDPRQVVQELGNTEREKNV